MPSERTLQRFRERGFSTCVESLDYDPESLELIIYFVKRGTYVYRDVPAEEAAGLVGATSQGTYFNLYVKDRYDYERIG